MRQNTKISGLRDILAGAVLVAAITMPTPLRAQSLPAEDQWVVVIDAGHGGKDPGAVGAKGKEKNINLSVALKTGKYISENMKDVKVIYTRDDDTFIGLAERAEVANRSKADIFISIHSNAISDKRFTGAETYVLGQSMDDANLQVAMKENSVITFEQDYQTKYEGYDPSSVESFIIFSLMQNTYLKQSTEFATLIQNQFRDRVGRKDRGVRQAGFVVLWRTTMPSVLVELGFITNADEEKFLLSEQGQDYLASAIFRAFRDYRQGIDSRSGIRNGNGVAAGQAMNGGRQDSSDSGNTGKTDSPGMAKPGKPDTSGTVNPGKPDSDIPESAANQVKAAVAGAGQHDSTVPVTSIETEPEPGSVKDNTSTAVITERTAPSNEEQTFFMVQVAAMPAGRELSHSQMNGIETVTRIKDGERIKYAAGKYVLYDDALKYRRTLTGRFPDAFVIAVRNGKIIPLREAIEAQKRNR